MTDADQLFTAISAGDENELDRILEAAPTLAGSTRDGLTTLRAAAYAGHPELAVPLERCGVAPDVFDAAALGDVDVLRDLIDDDPDLVNQHAPDGFTPLHLAAWFGHTKAAEVLLARGADPQAVAANGTELHPLNSAAAAGNTVIVHLLLDRGADVDATQEHGITALHSAAAHNDAEMVALLLGRGADPYVTTEDGRSAAQLTTDPRILALLP
ncbi:ankyrin repeat domain-containing protein [Aquihabitans sp. G128]|uniref:ankyrin repeat domain-containing protein n=1 Tax=Aquihabitans sp. G128 TaxID=2849779 RepID=UPI001C237B0F|nr:ankyrin repeat domain-containing protein [Aquihabitans sp. G128]QXC61817.1 ankyrin repeat domain-containing protein [Aquihabitans sp. G128]